MSKSQRTPIKEDHGKPHSTEPKVFVSKFQPQSRISTDISSKLASSTVGLIQADEFKRKRENIIVESLANAASSHSVSENIHNQKENISKKQFHKLSFYDSEEEDVVDTDTNLNTKRIKNPDVDTSFLPDKIREEEERNLREFYCKEFLYRQSALKNESIPIIFGFWDGSGETFAIEMKKGDTILDFLKKAAEKKRTSADNLLFVKDDLIIPSGLTFYELIINETKGATEVLWKDLKVDNTRVVFKWWYEKFKHVFPASKWEPLDTKRHYKNRSQ